MFRLILICLTCFFVLSCGTNVYESLDKKGTADEAALLLEKGDSAGAISLLENALEDDSSNTVYLSLLSMAYAQRAGFDPIEYLLNISSSSEEGASSADRNEITSTFSLLPEPTGQNISDIEHAVTLLTQIPAAQRVPEDKLKLSLFQVFAVSLRTKSFDADGDGDLSPLEVANLSADAAIAILNTLAAADQNMDGAETDGDSQDAFAKTLSSINSEIGAVTGDTDEEKAEKVREYLGGSS